jgi:hypothetical protein
MKPPRPADRHPILFVEATEFERQSSRLLNAMELKALRFLLADDPTCGSPVSDLPGLLKICYAGCVIYYAIAPSFLKIYLLDIEKDDDDSPPPTKPSTPPTDEEITALRKTLRLLSRGLLIVVVKRGLKWLWEYCKDEFLGWH